MSVFLCFRTDGFRTEFFLFLCITTLVQAEVQHNYYWRDYRGTIPEDALNGTEDLYVAQVPFNGLLPATLYPEKREAVSECFGKKIIVQYAIKLLCDQFLGSFHWDHVNVNKLTEDKLDDLVIGGREADSTLYIGKVYHEGEWKIGKVFPRTSPHKGLRIWYNNGEQYSTDDFQVLKYRPQPIHIFNVRDGAP